MIMGVVAAPVMGALGLPGLLGVAGLMTVLAIRFINSDKDK